MTSLSLDGCPGAFGGAAVSRTPYTWTLHPTAGLGPIRDSDIATNQEYEDTNEDYKAANEDSKAANEERALTSLSLGAGCRA